MMAFPATFAFSQSSLKDYRDCPRRFRLRYLERLAWPAPQSLDLPEWERRLRLGEAFHSLVRRHQSGVPVQALSLLAAATPELARWWQVYLSSPYANLAARVRRPEISLAAPLAGRYLEAQFDLLAGDPGGDWQIFDWKTGEDATPRSRLETHPQTVVYRFLLAEAGASLNGGLPIPPERITMIYWFAAGHRAPEAFPYSSDQFARDRETLCAWISEIVERSEADWPATTDERRCIPCLYRSFCARAVATPSPEELEAQGELVDGIIGDLDMVEEIAF